MRRIILLLSLMCMSLSAQEFKESVERRGFTTTIQVVVHKPITFKLDTALKDGWQISDKITPLKSSFKIPPQISFLKQQDGTFFCWAPVGNYLIESQSTLINWTKQDVDERDYTITLIVTGTGPQPPPDPIPDPIPQPNNPFTTDKMKVLLIEEQDERGKIPREQSNIFTNAEVRAYLDSKFEWLLLDKDTVFNNENEWKKAIALQRTGNWWVVIGNKQKFESVPLPANSEQMLVLLKKYGG